MNNVDVLVAGGGMVGATCALGLALQGKKIAIIEKLPPKAYLATQPMDLRISALSQGSVKLLENLDVWQSIRAMRACPYQELATWENEDNPLKFSAQSLNLPQLGFMVENRVVQLALWQSLQKMPNVTFYCPDQLSCIEKTKGDITVCLNSGTQISAQLLIAADGANSWIRTQLGIGITAWDYRQQCLLINIKTAEKTIADPITTWQHFTPQGPRAFLPFIDNQASLVWYDLPEKIAELKMMDTKQLSEHILQQFPKRLGNIDVVDCASFSLTRRHAQHYFKNNVVLVGDAAHTINPLAGQGVNLGFKDAAMLINLIEQAKENWSDSRVLQAYQTKRKKDNLLMQTAMDIFYQGFSNNSMPAKFFRNLTLKAVEHCSPLKQQVLKYAIGLE